MARRSEACPLAPTRGAAKTETQPGVRTSMDKLSDLALERVATVFKALSEPRRLRLLNALRDGEKNVGELVELADTSQANVSKHMAVMMQAGIVAREPRGTSVYYRMADPATFQLCDIVCGQLLRRLMSEQEWQAAFAAPWSPAQD